VREDFPQQPKGHRQPSTYAQQNSKYSPTVINFVFLASTSESGKKQGLKGARQHSESISLANFLDKNSEIYMTKLHKNEKKRMKKLVTSSGIEKDKLLSD